MFTLLLHKGSDVWFPDCQSLSVFLGRQGWQWPIRSSALTELFLHEEQLLSASASLHFLELNDREENENHFPIIYGIAVNIKTAEIYRASFQDRGPEEQLRAARALAGGPMISIYDAKTEQLRIGPCSWTPFPHVDFWLQQDDKQILENLSTSPLAEPPHFVDHIRSTLMFLKKFPSPENILFPGNKALLYRKNKDGLWEKISPGN
ncbi:rCG49780, isoform CRA_a [Rattus norvegicus]|nr:rCG49780, isoform CRA_a [Rattus norvegicus]